MTERKIISISPVLAQLYLRKLAQFGSSYFGNDVYALKEFVDVCMNEVGVEKLIEMLKMDEGENKERNRYLGNNWEKIQLRLNKFDKMVSIAKPLYDKVENKKFTKISEKDVKDAIRASSKISIIKQDVYTLAVFLIKNSTLQRMTVPSDAWKILERTHKIIGAPQRRPVTPQQNPEIEISKEE